MTRPLIGLSLLLVTVTLSFADSPASRFDYVAKTENEQFEFRMFVPNVDVYETTNRKSGLYPDNCESSDPLWTVDWYAFEVIPHSNGKNLVRPRPWASSTSDLAVAFYENGDELKRYRISELITDESKLPDIREKAYTLIRNREQRRKNALLFIEQMTGFVDQSDIIRDAAAKTKWSEGLYAWFENEGLELTHISKQVLDRLMRSFTPSGSTHAINEDTIHRLVSSAVFSEEIDRLNSPEYVSAIGNWNKKYLSKDLID